MLFVYIQVHKNIVITRNLKSIFMFENTSVIHYWQTEYHFYTALPAAYHPPHPPTPTKCWKHVPLKAYLQGNFLLLADHGSAKTEALLLLAWACPLRRFMTNCCQDQQACPRQRPPSRYPPPPRPLR